MRHKSRALAEALAQRMGGSLLTEEGRFAICQRMFALYLDMRYRLTPSDVEPTDTPGYWRERRPCEGAGKCRHPLHACLGNEGGVRHTVEWHNRTHWPGVSGSISPHWFWRKSCSAASAATR